MTAQFPRELVDEILDHSADDRPSLKTYSLVSREWVSRCRSHLFGECALWPSRITPFCELVRSPHCTFLSHVRTINNVKHYGAEDYDCFNEIAADLACLVNVCELQMEFTTPYLPEKLDPFLRTAFPKLTHLVVDLQGLSEEPMALVNMMCLFPALQELDMEMSGKLEDIPADAVPPPELSSLSLSEYSAGEILTWLDATGHLPKVHSLTLPTLKHPDIPIVRTALRKIGGELHHLDITLRGSPEGVETLEVIDLSLHPKLKTLDIRDSAWGDSEATNTTPLIPKFVAKLAAPALEHLLLELDLSRTAYENLDWAALDAFLSPAQFPRLRSVVVRCEQHGDHGYDLRFYNLGEDDEEPVIDFEHEFVRRALPLLNDSGLLQTHWEKTEC
ncbi:hypothetical protein K438DRAFT_1925107 [Mycena galopus ATCC 62051]|nr:hypothetical protein K438DRAFT_1925107 [Mycena galopus ATCC 62051]